MVLFGLALLPIIGWVDYMNGIYISFTVFYLPPMALVAWYGGKWLGILSALEGALIWEAADYFDVPLLPLALHIWNALTRFAVFAIVSLFVRSLYLQLEGLQARIDLKTIQAVAFHRVLPLCPHCKRICDEQGNWRQVEDFLKDKMDVEFSHSLCPDSTEEHRGGDITEKV
jgi:hypothetical protein